MGVSNDNYDEVMKTDRRNVCGLKIFMGSSTGNMLVDDSNALEKIFSSSDLLIATHCEDEGTIRRNLEDAVNKFGENIPASMHPVIRNAEACYKSSSNAVGLAKKHGTRLHVLHISTEKELSLFSNDIPLPEKKITAEACIHHLWFDDSYYDQLGMKIKWNPAIKKSSDRQAVFNAMLDGTIDVIATDHAPHTIEEKSQSYLKAPSGGPLVQHALVAMMELYHDKKISLEKIAEKMSHAVAECFRIKDRGYIREGYFADLVLVNPDSSWNANDNILSKCQWTPFENQAFRSKVIHTFVNGKHVVDNGRVNEIHVANRLEFYR
jgi:dihydroorotase